MPPAVNTASRLGELACAIPDQELDGGRALAQVRRKFRAACVAHAPSGCAVDAGQAGAASAMLDDDQGSVECSFVAVHRIRVTWESSQVRTAFGRQSLPRSDST